MLRLTAALAVAAAATAQQSPELTSSDGILQANLPVNGDLTATRTRRQTISVGDLADQLSVLTASVSDMAANAAVFQGAESMTNAMLSATVENNLQVATAQQSIETRLGALETTNAAALSSMASQMAALQSNINRDLSTASATMASTLLAAEQSSSRHIDELSTNLSTSVASSLSQAANAMNELNTSLTTAMRAKLNTVRHMWIGVCSSHAYGSSEICHNRPEINTMAPYFRSASNTRFAAIRRGFYRISLHNINESCGWAHTMAYINGRRLYITYMHTNGWWWKDGFVDEVGEVLGGQQFWVQVSSSCGRNSAHANNHQRQTYTYEGAARVADV